MRVSGYPTGPTDKQVDQLRFYRTAVGGTLYYLATTINRSNTSGRFTPTAFTYSGTTLGDLMPTDHDAPPNVCGPLVLYNSSLFARGYGSNKHIVYRSTTNSPEYWPQYQFGADSPTALNYSLGGFFTVGDGGTPIMDLVPEMGVLSSKDARGSSLLILKESGLAYRLYGSDWSDFVLDEAFAHGAIDAGTAKRWNELVLWLSPQGPVAVQAGGSQIIPLYEKVFPITSLPFSEQHGTVNVKHMYPTIVWKDWFFFSFMSATYVSRTYAIHLPSLTYTQFAGGMATLNLSCFAVFDGPGDNGGLYAGGHTDETIWRLFSKTGDNTYNSGATGVRWQWKSPIITGEPQMTGKVKEIQEVRFFWQKPAATSAFTAQLIKNGGSSGVAKQYSINTAGNDQRKLVRWHPSEHGWGFQLSLTGTATVPNVLEGIEIDYKAEGDYVE